jgi:hypothetical protein
MFLSTAFITPSFQLEKSNVSAVAVVAEPGEIEFVATLLGTSEFITEQGVRQAIGG